MTAAETAYLLGCAPRHAYRFAAVLGARAVPLKREGHLRSYTRYYFPEARVRTFVAERLAQLQAKLATLKSRSR